MSRPTREEVAQQIFQHGAARCGPTLTWTGLLVETQEHYRNIADWHLAELDKKVDECAEAADKEFRRSGDRTAVYSAVMCLKQPPAPKWCEHCFLTSIGAMIWKVPAVEGLNWLPKEVKFCPICGTPRPKDPQ